MVLASTNSPLYELKTVLCERKIRTERECISFYSPYNELYIAYTMKSAGEKMWGLGFRKDKIDNWIAKEQLKPNKATNGKLERLTVNTNEIDLTDFEVTKNDFFLVVPDTKAMKELCFGEKIPNTNYYYWRCKGLNNIICKGKNDQEIDDYLNKGYRFAKRNNIAIDEKDLFPNHQLIKTSNVVKLVG